MSTCHRPEWEDDNYPECADPAVVPDCEECPYYSTEEN